MSHHDDSQRVDQARLSQNGRKAQVHYYPKNGEYGGGKYPAKSAESFHKNIKNLELICHWRPNILPC